MLDSVAAEADISTRSAAIMGKASGGLDRSRGGISEKYWGERYFCQGSMVTGEGDCNDSRRR